MSPQQLIDLIESGDGATLTRTEYNSFHDYCVDNDVDTDNWRTSGWGTKNIYICCA